MEEKKSTIVEALENIVDKIDEVTMSQRKKRDISTLTCSEFIEDLQVLREEPFYSPLTCTSPSNILS